MHAAALSQIQILHLQILGQVDIRQGGIQCLKCFKTGVVAERKGCNTGIVRDIEGLEDGVAADIDIQKIVMCRKPIALCSRRQTWV